MRRNPGETIELRTVERLCIFDRAFDAFAKLGLASRNACDAALALGPIACGKIVQYLREPVLLQTVRELAGAIRIGKQVFDALEAGVFRGLEAVEKINFVEEHRQIGGEFRHRSSVVVAFMRLARPEMRIVHQNAQIRNEALIFNVSLPGVYGHPARSAFASCIFQASACASPRLQCESSQSFLGAMSSRLSLKPPFWEVQTQLYARGGHTII